MNSNGSTKQPNPEPILNISERYAIKLSGERWRNQGLRGYIAGISGSGKTNLVAVLMEEAYRIGLPFVIVDPMDDYRSLKELGPVVAVVSARSGDVDLTYPREDWALEAIRRLGAGQSVVVDLSSIFGASDKRHAYCTLVRMLLKHQQAYRRPMFFVTEEAHVFCPQKRQQDVEALELAAEVARQGRRSGINSILASQRPRDLEADIASQCNLHFCGALEFALDYEAVRYLLAVPDKASGQPARRNGYRPPPKGFEDQVQRTPELPDLMALKAGQFYVRVGASLRLVQVRRRATTHIGATPEIVYRQKSLFE